MNGWVAHALVAACVSALGLGVYDMTVRQPRTPRLAMVDIARLYAAADRTFKERALARGPDDASASVPEAVPAGALRRAQDFGPAVETVLKGLADECHCAIVAMATVIGGHASIADVTQEAARRLGLVLPERTMP